MTPEEWETWHNQRAVLCLVHPCPSNPTPHGDYFDLCAGRNVEWTAQRAREAGWIDVRRGDGPPVPGPRLAGSPVTNADVTIHGPSDDAA